MTTILAEVCVESAGAAIVAQESGADRLELCAALPEGGVTPSLGMVRTTLAVVRVPVHVLVRPRGGNFAYGDLEFRAMLDDVRLLRDAGVHGVVSGCLTPDGRVDVQRTQALIGAASPLPFTFHRAFDLTADPAVALELLIQCGVSRVLTSGQAATALDGREQLSALLQQAGDRIVILGCGRIRSDSVTSLLETVPLREIHFAGHKTVQATAPTGGAGVRLGSADGDALRVPDGDLIAATIQAARRAVVLR